MNWKRTCQGWALFLVCCMLCMTFEVFEIDETQAGGKILGITYDTLAVAEIETTAVFDLRGTGATVLGVQSNCDSLKFTVQISLTGYTEYTSVGDTALTATSVPVWVNIGTPTQPVQINATAGTPGLHWLREISVTPPDGAISSDFSSNVAPAPFMRVIFQNNDSASPAINTVLRIMTGE